MLIDAEPFSLFEQMEDGAFDIAAVNDFESDLDLIPWLRYKKSAQRLQKTTFLHRGEDVFRYEFYMQMFHLLMSTYDPETYAAAPDDEEASAASFEFLQNLTKDIRVTDVQQIDELLTLDGILKLMAN